MQLTDNFAQKMSKCPSERDKSKRTKRSHERITKEQEINNTYLTKIIIFIILFGRNAKKISGSEN